MTILQAFLESCQSYILVIYGSYCRNVNVSSCLYQRRRLSADNIRIYKEKATTYSKILDWLAHSQMNSFLGNALFWIKS